MPRRSARSRSRGRPDRYEEAAATPKPKKVAKPKAEAEPEEKKMFGEGEAVMARWPGSSLFFKAKVVLVREEDEEYDVEYENGTVYTVRAKDVYKADSKVLKKAAGARRSKSRGRGRSAGRQKKAAAEPAAGDESAAEDTAAAADTTDTAAEEKPKPAPKTPKTPKAKAVATPARVSARIAAKATLDAVSDDEEVVKKAELAPNPELPDARGRKKGWSFEWVWCLFFMVLGPALLLSLHTLCTKAACRLEVPQLPRTLDAYFNMEAFKLTLAAGVVIPSLSYLPVGKTVNGQRMNGFLALVLCLAAVPGLVYAKVPLSIVRDNYFQLLATMVAWAGFDSVLYYAMSFRATKGQLNKTGNTGNPIVDLFNGRVTNLRVAGLEAKLTMFRFSMISLALLNVVMVTDSIVKAGGQANPATVLGASFQVVITRIVYILAIVSGRDKKFLW